MAGDHGHGRRSTPARTAEGTGRCHHLGVAWRLLIGSQGSDRAVSGGPYHSVECMVVAPNASVECIVVAPNASAECICSGTERSLM